eukprot:g29919.t1
MFGKQDFEQLAQVVDAFSLMTYDFSNQHRLQTSGSLPTPDNLHTSFQKPIRNGNPTRPVLSQNGIPAQPVLSGAPGPNSPLPWIQACVQKLDPDAVWRNKILLGLNFYGMDYGILGGTAEPIVGH